MFGLTLERICKFLQDLTKFEKEQRKAFNKEYGQRLPQSMNKELLKGPMQILFCPYECEASTQYSIIEKSNIKPEKIQNLLSSLIKNLLPQPLENIDAKCLKKNLPQDLN